MAFLAGCDDLDSDGDGKVDICEDRFAPEILVRDAKLFRCDRDNTSRLCYTGQVFSNEKDARNFLEYEFPASDDCTTSPKKLSVTIDKTGGSCYETTYKLTPVQNIPECNGTNFTDIELNNNVTISFENPLLGSPKVVTMQLDEVAPVVECGFFPQPNSINVIENKTLYYYLSDTDMNALRLNDARLNDAHFYYNVTVSECTQSDFAVRHICGPFANHIFVYRRTVMQMLI